MSSPAPQSVRQRGAQQSKKQTTAPASNEAADTLSDTLSKAQKEVKSAVSSEWDYKLALAVITVLAFATRFYGISHPNQVVFDEVHFGKFASYYLQRTYFFDVHPPFGKLLFAFAGWLVGYKGEFLFDNIGDSYVTNKVPYVAYRSMPALMGSLTVTTTFLIMWESGYSLPACVVAAGLLLFDNAHIGQTRLILLDATLVLSMALSVLCYIRFYKLRHAPFSRKWWKWLLLTGFCLSCVISTKYVGAFTFFSIGVPVAIDLWDLLDVNRRQGPLTLPQFGKHLGARVIGLIVVPFFFYLFWFQVHFAILNRSGPGDDFMSPEFQETLSDNIMSQQSVSIDYFDSITLRHKETKVYLHSHLDKYPLRYDDGRTRSRLYNSTGFFFLTWAAHYIPFFVMGRQLFLHHYLPAHLASCLVTGALVEFVFNIEPVSLNELSAGNATFSTDGKKPSKKTAGADTPVRSSRPVRERLGQQNLMASWAAAAVILAVVVWSFGFFAPLTYGSPGLDIDQVNARKWLNYDLHFAK
ncbi:Dolichyl-phosphate-mannose--protein mannosyltransferase 4 [Cryomyces antarcticus]|uniref:Dolichyl-phosphate-mannose--protein mannosyltransferase n=1 Tax=Cryomyces antarcticus TaxID=329879 RepID=A0ABR0M7R9_9PEZI|nr:Dolichyl-phosphate-mannose--protein mannosyltransferase 4 [Cryomyces antarcticus]KAK5290612.1 Dolichyl-phosphate-mannose--protein mannosyltransferase 4 [Cryomyces antarcticus]